MVESATLLVELRTEELPPKSLKRLGEAFAQGLFAGLRERDFVATDGALRMFATPRRLAVSIANVLAVAPDKPFKEKLLPVSIAFDAAGKPTAALLGKLKARQLAHLDPATLPREHDGKAEVLYYADIAKGGPLVNALQAALDDVIAKLPIAKVMSYAGDGAYYNNQKFVRPAHGLIALHGGNVVDVHALGLLAGRTTAGHRFLSRPDLDIATADAYEPTLEAEGKVIVDFAKRRAAIVTALERASEHAQVIMPDALLDEVTALVEWPAVYAGTFDRAFLDVPQECLILTMQQNQKYFALADEAGALRHRFLLVSNLPTDDPSAIIQGNERVLRARLADAKFFYDQDRRQRLETRLPKLANVVYHNKLGSQLDRVERIRAVAAAIAPALGADPALADRAAMLAKADLTTDMVGEFPELQGTMGRYYALNDGETPAVADAIAQHYWPRFAGDSLPQGPVSNVVALADKVESLVGMFGVGNVPTGDKDPFGLRRAALGIVRILDEGNLALPFFELCAAAQNSFSQDGFDPTAFKAARDFIVERLRGYLRDSGASAQEVDAVLAQNKESLVRSIPEIRKMLQEVVKFNKLSEVRELAEMNKRVLNIISKNKQELGFDATCKERLLVKPAEKALHQQMKAIKDPLDRAWDDQDYGAYLHTLLSLKSNLATFFDRDTGVLVMDPDPQIRANRAGLLQDLGQMLNKVADISKLAV